MSSKKKNLDDELSDVSSEEENIVNFAKKGEKNKKKENKEEKILSKKTKREKESESDSESEKSEKNQNKKIKKDKTAHNSNEKNNEENEEIKLKKNEHSKNKKKINIKDSSDSDEESDEDNEEKVKPKSKNENKNKTENKKEKKSESDSDSDSSKENKIIKAKEKKSKKLEKEEEEEEEEKEKKEEKKDSEKSEKSSEEEEEKDNNNNSEPKLVKNSNKEEEDLKKEKKSYNSGTWPELFVNNLSYKTTDSSLKKYFSKYGEVESTKIVVDKETGRPKGVGFCKFCDSESAAKALADNDNLFLDGRPLAVSYSNDKKGSAKVRKSKFQGDKNFSGEKFSIFIGNLSFKTNEDGIKNLFEDCGNIIDIRIAKRPDGNPRGFAHVDFDSKEAMENALEKTGYRLDGRELRIDKTTNQPSANKKTFGENSYYKYKKENKGEKEEKDENNIDIEKAKKTGKIINTGSKSQKIENSDSDSDDE